MAEPSVTVGHRLYRSHDGRGIECDRDPANGRVNLYGIELEGAFRVTHKLTLEGTFGYAETNIRQTVCAAITGNVLWINSSGVVNAHLGMATDRYTIEVFGKNICNSTVPINIGRTDTNGNAIALAPQTKPSFGVRLAARY